MPHIKNNNSSGETFLIFCWTEICSLKVSAQCDRLHFNYRLCTQVCLTFFLQKLPILFTLLLLFMNCERRNSFAISCSSHGEQFLNDQSCNTIAMLTAFVFEQALSSPNQI